MYNHASGTLTLTDSFFNENQGGGLVSVGPGTPEIFNTPLADNSPYNCAGVLASLGHNLEDGDSCGFGATGDLKNSDPLVGPLVDYGGPTLTYALLAGRPAI